MAEGPSPPAEHAGDLLTPQAGEVVFRPGDLGSTTFFVEEGEIELLASEDGQRLATLGPGDFFGERSALCGGARHCCARAVSAARLIAVDAATLTALIDSRPQLALALLRRLSTRLETALLATSGAEGALAHPSAPIVRLLHPESGESFALPEKDEVVIGRRGSGVASRPDVDLTAIDPARSLSRRHARLRRTGSGFVLSEEPKVANGSWVGGRRLKPGEGHPLRAGDGFRLGRVELTLEIG